MPKYGKTRDHYANERWMKVKKVDRPKQVWVWDDEDKLTGHWERANAA